MIDGMEMDARAAMRAPPMAGLERYCRCVAGAVGVLSVHVFGARAPDRIEGAVALGEALQLTNILRDLAEDADFGRLYLPRELLAKHGIASDQPDEVLDDPALPAVCRELAARAARRFDEADRWLAQEDRRDVRPALIMRGVYRLTLVRLIADDWRQLRPPVRPGTAARLWVAIRCLL
jgi:phytoene synthase